mmetsp:Transcript_81878/g.265236  ORF Transcript_81878/g.265236 Transcript_81878/m.265236 type:complete len:245 (+) Transcript_81878:809-1543(+)
MARPPPPRTTRARLHPRGVGTQEQKRQHCLHRPRSTEGNGRLHGTSRQQAPHAENVRGCRRANDCQSRSGEALVRQELAQSPELEIEPQARQQSVHVLPRQLCHAWLSSTDPKKQILCEAQYDCHHRKEQCHPQLTLVQVRPGGGIVPASVRLRHKRIQAAAPAIARGESDDRRDAAGEANGTNERGHLLRIVRPEVAGRYNRDQVGNTLQRVEAGAWQRQVNDLPAQRRRRHTIEICARPPLL